MLVTICTVRQLPQALALAQSYCQFAGDRDQQPEAILLGLADNPVHLPAGFSCPYPLLPISELLPPDELTALSARYTPTEFAAACKPLFIREALRRYPTVDQFLYADPNVFFTGSLAPVWEQLANATLLLTPHTTQAPNDGRWPDEKYFQNVGLYSSDFLALRRSAETDRFLAWWQDRVQPRAFIDFCNGLCTDQLWLMHVPVFFREVVVVKDPGWHVALWNLPWRNLHQHNDLANWFVTTSTNAESPLSFVNFKGLLNPDDGFFAHQNRLRPARRPDVRALLSVYRIALTNFQSVGFEAIYPAYGQLPEPVVLRGWREITVRSFRTVTRFLDRVPLPVFR